MTEQRLPMVDGDDGNWGNVLNQYLTKEHYNTGIDNAANGGHKMVTLRPGTVTAGTAPLKFTSGPLLSTPEAGAVEYSAGSFYIRGTDNLSVAGSITGSTLASNVATGTTPLTVASNTVVTNLNADMIDGKHASDLVLSVSNYNVGDIVAFSGGASNIPSNGILADGRAISRTTYADYFTLVGTTYGTGDGSTTFNIPNLQGKVTAGLDASQTEFNTLGFAGGEKTHKLTVPETPSHTHKQAAAKGTGDSTYFDAQVAHGYNSVPGYQDYFTSSTGGDGSHNNLQPYITVNYYVVVTKNVTNPGITGNANTVDNCSVNDSVAASSSVLWTSQKILQTVYPVGSIYMSATSTSPATLFGFGTWTAWGSGRVPLGIGSNGTTNYTTVEATGGEEKHALTQAELPAINAEVRTLTGWEVGVGAGSLTGLALTYSTTTMGDKIVADLHGGGVAHNNMQPYITCYMWKRTA